MRMIMMGLVLAAMSGCATVRWQKYMDAAPSRIIVGR